MPGPLEGVRVVELAARGPIPLACRLLSELGAQVLRLDRPGGDAFGGLSDGQAASRPTLEVDLKSPEGLAQLLDLVSRADVLVEGFRPGAAERMGLGPAECTLRNPRLIYARMTGWGQDGPLAQTAGHDINYLAVTGALHAIGEVGGKPVAPLNLVGDLGGGSMFLIMGILAALVERARSGAGQTLDVSMVDGVSQLMSPTMDLHRQGLWADERGVNLLDGGAPFYDTYLCADDKYVAVGALEPQFYGQLVAGLGLSDPPSQEPKDWTRARALFTAAFLTRTRQQWTEHFAGTDACVSPVLSLAEAQLHPHLRARGMWTREPGGAVRAAPAPRLSRTAAVLGDQDVHADVLLRVWGVA